MFLGSVSTFLVAIMLSIFYLAYTGKDLLVQIKKDIEIEISIKNEIKETKNTSDFFVNCDLENGNNFKTSPDILKRFYGFIDDPIPIKNIYLSNNFQRPPPCYLS